MTNVERVRMIESLTHELVENVETLDAAKKSGGTMFYGNQNIVQSCCTAGIKRKITLIREQLMCLSKEVTPYAKHLG